jgi:uncharacterized protein YbjQ (UPF0145 family)
MDTDEEVAMHELPPAARERLNRAKRSGVRTSLLSAPSAVGLAAVGLEPVGEVMGCTVRTQPLLTAAPPTYRGWRRGYDFDVFCKPRLDARRTGYTSALSRMRREAEALGADGIVGVTLTRSPRESCDEYVAMGTTVRAQSKVRPKSLFTTDLSGTDVAKLMLAGWVPAQFLWAGAAHSGLARVGPLGLRRTTSYRIATMELDPHTQLVNDTRADARDRFDAMAADANADGSVVSRTSLSTWEPFEGVVCVLATVRGTAVARFGRPDPEPTETLTVMPLRQGER